MIKTNKRGPKESVIPKLYNTLLDLYRIYTDNPQTKISKKICNAVANNNNVKIEAVSIIMKYVKKPEPPKWRDAVLLAREQYEYRQRTGRSSTSAEKAEPNQLFAKECFIEHKELPPTATVEVTISEVSEIAVRYLRENNLKSLKIERREENTPLITFE